MAATSTADGSVVIGVDMNVSDAEKSLARLNKKIEQLEAQIKKNTLKRQEADQRGVLAAAELDAEKAKLLEIKDRLADIRAMAKDTSLSKSAREDAKALIPMVQEEYTEQRDRVRGLQTEFNKIYSGVERYDQKIKELNSDLEVQKAAAGELGREIAEGTARFQEIAGAAGVADQRIIDLSRELSALISRQKELESVGVGLGYQEYDQNAARIANITQELNRYKKALTEAASEEITSSQQMETAMQNAEALTQQMEAAIEKQRQAAEENAQNRLNAYLEKTSSLYQKLSGMIGKTTEASSVLQGIAASTGGKLSSAFQTASAAAGGFGKALSGVLSKAGPYLAAAAAVAKVLKILWQQMVKFSQGFTAALKKGTEAVVNFSASVARNFVSALKAIGEFADAASKTISGLAKNAVEFGKKINVFSKLSNTLKSKFKQLGSTIKSALVFSVIYQGLSLLRQQIGAYLSANTQFITALRRLQGVLLTAFQPIYETVVPALTTLINVLTHAAATVAQFFASLFGTTAKRAQANAESLYNQASATTAVGESAEEASKQLAAFDEINKLEGSKKPGGGGSTSVDMGPLFDYEYDETPFKPWGEAFSDFLDKLLDGIPKLRDAFKKFANWLNDFARKLYDMFTFPGVLDKVKRLGSELAAALNDLVNWIDWRLLGNALGAGLNLALNFLTSFLYKFDWMNLGRKLADFVNGLAEEIDWYEFGRLLWAGFKIGLETLAGFITGLNMPLMADAASKTIIGFFDEMKNTVERIPWGEIGTQIADFLTRFDWYGTIISMFEAISAGIMGLKEMVDNFLLKFDWKGTADAIARAVNEAIPLANWRGIGETIGYALQTAFAFAEELVSKIHWDEIGQNIADFILGFDFAGALGGMADLIVAGINAAINLARGFLDKIMPEAESIAKDIAERIKNAVKSVEWRELGEVVGDSIKTALKFVAGLLDPETFYEIGKAIGDFLIGLDWPGIIGGLAEVLANGIKSAVAAVNGFLDSVKPNLKQIASDIAEKINQFVNDVDWAELGKTINEGINTALDFLLDILDQLDWDSIGDAVVDFLSNLDWGGLLEKWGTVVGTAIGDALKGIDLGDAIWLGNSIIDGLWKGMCNKWDESGGVLGWIKEFLFSPFIEGFSSLFGIASPSTVMEEQGEFLIAGLLQGITNTWNSIADFFSEKLEALKTTLSNAWEAMKTTSSTIWENIKTTLGQTWDSIREKASTVFNSMKEKISTVWSGIKETTSSIWSDIKSSLSSTWSSIKSSAETTFNTLKEKVVSTWNTLKTDTSSKWTEIKTTLSNTWQGIKTNAESKFQEVKQSIIDKMGELKKYDWASIGKSIVNSFLKGLEDIWNRLTSWASKVKNTISEALSGAANARSGTFGASTQGGYGSGRMAAYSMPDISTFHIPALAAGAVIPPNREFLAVLGDQRNGTNVEAPLSTIEQAVANVMSRMGGNREMTVIMEIDGREFGRASYKYGTAERQRVGVRLTEART